MSRIVVWVVGVCLACGIGTLRAGENVWTDQLGRTYKGELRGIYGGLALVSSDKRGQLLPLAQMDDATLDRAAEQAAALAPRRDWKSTPSPVAKAIRTRLQVWDGDKLVEFSPEGRAEPEIFLVYFSAHWCGPCRRFTPRLVEEYQQMKREFGDLFELIFVSDDRNAEEQKRYVQEVGMPWTALKFNQRGRVRIIEQWAGNGIPCLATLTKDGDVLFHSYRGNEYQGPQEPLDYTRQLLAQMKSNTAETKLARHRFAVRQHVRSAAAGAVVPAPYLLSVDGASYRRSGLSTFVAEVAVDAEGRARLLNTRPELDAILADQLRREVGAWLFLPAAEEGRSKASVVSVPLQF